MYYYINESGVAVPATPDEFVGLIQRAAVNANTGVWHIDDEHQRYVPASSRAELKQYFVVPPPVPPVVQATPVTTTVLHVPVHVPVPPAVVVSETPKTESKKPAAWLQWLQAHKAYVVATLLFLGAATWYLSRDKDLSLGNNLTQSEAENKTELIRQHFRKAYTSARVGVTAGGSVSVTFSNRSKQHTFMVNKVRIPVKGYFGLSGQEFKDFTTTISIPAEESVTQSFNIGYSDKLSGEPVVLNSWINIE